MSEPQLERSVLEAKAREELHAIADALGTKPGSRAKKSDLIAQILRATGVETDFPEPVDKPRRTRARKAVTPVSGEATDGVVGETVDRDAVAAPLARPIVADAPARPSEPRTGDEERAEQLALD